MNNHHPRTSAATRRALYRPKTHRPDVAYLKPEVPAERLYDIDPFDDLDDPIPWPTWREKTLLAVVTIAAIAQAIASYLGLA